MSILDKNLYNNLTLDWDQYTIDLRFFYQLLTYNIYVSNIARLNSTVFDETDITIQEQILENRITLSMKLSIDETIGSQLFLFLHIIHQYYLRY